MVQLFYAALTAQQYEVLSALDKVANISLFFGTLHHHLAIGAELIAGEAAPGDAKGYRSALLPDRFWRRWVNFEPPPKRN